jgi:hypothetical protein
MRRGPRAVIHTADIDSSACLANSSAGSPRRRQMSPARIDVHKTVFSNSGPADLSPVQMYVKTDHRGDSILARASLVCPTTWPFSGLVPSVSEDQALQRRVGQLTRVTWSEYRRLGQNRRRPERRRATRQGRVAPRLQGRALQGCTTWRRRLAPQRLLAEEGLRGSAAVERVPVRLQSLPEAMRLGSQRNYQCSRGRRDRDVVLGEVLL